MVDLLSLRISQWLLVRWRRRIGVELDIQIEDVVAESLGGAEGCEEEGRAEGLRGGEELDWEVFLGLRQLAGAIA